MKKIFLYLFCIINLSFGFLTSASLKIYDEIGSLLPKRISEDNILEEKEDLDYIKVLNSENIKPQVIRYSSLERRALIAGEKNLADLMQKLRLLNPYPKKSLSHSIWEEQCQFNIPILILSSLYINDFCQKNDKHRLLFCARDCCLLVKIFKALFPKYESIYFYSSRLMYKNPSPEFIEYVKKNYNDNTVIIDGKGSGETCSIFFNKYFKFDPCYISLVGKSTLFYSKNSVTRNYGNHIEILNNANHGSLKNFTNQGPLFLKIEYDLKYITPAYACIDKCVELIPEYKFKNFNPSLIRTFFKAIEKYNPIINRHIRHDANHAQEEFTWKDLFLSLGKSLFLPIEIKYHPKTQR